MFLLVIWSPKQFKFEESFEESWVKLRSHFAKSKSGLQGEKVKRICHEAYSWWQSWQPLLEHFMKSNWCMLYTISNLKKSTIQFFKRCAIQSWNEEVTAIASQSLRAEGSIFQSAAKSPFCCEVIPQLFCTVGCISSWRCPTYTARRKLGTSRWTPTSIYKWIRERIQW